MKQYRFHRQLYSTQKLQGQGGDGEEERHVYLVKKEIGTKTRSSQKEFFHP